MLALAGGLTLAACGSSGHPTSSQTTATPATTAPSSASTAPSGGQHLTVTPSQGLKSPATVSVTATGFSPHESLVVTQCANKGNSTGPGDCNLAGIKSVTANSAGQVNAQITVIKGPFGTNHIVCTTNQTCLVSVSQASATTTQEATQTIGFS
jgi:hypothetical protein